MSQQIDDLDREIIEHLTVDGRASASEIAQRIGKVSERTIRNRISALLQSRQIVIGAIPDPVITEPGVHAEVLIDVEPGLIDKVALDLFRDERNIHARRLETAQVAVER
ncbi:MAG: AsnC family transcriptional regulator, partial [Rhodobacteraceae bacterium]|nr:AsnC family transcriptional regulator [Paracoccaceae bacterium]